MIYTVWECVSDAMMCNARDPKAIEHHVKDKLVRLFSNRILEVHGDSIKRSGGRMSDGSGTSFTLSLHVNTEQELEDYVQYRILKAKVKP